jgi:4-hydroxy 2-oxovalerate aldolase
MNMKILDCTLRDGGYYTNWDFAPDLVSSYIEGVNALPVVIIEIGYKTPLKAGYLGEYRYVPKSTLGRLRDKAREGLRFAVMLDAKDCEVRTLPSLLSGCEGAVDLVRLAVARDRVGHAVSLARELKALGYGTALNVMRAHDVLDDPGLFDELAAAADTIDYVYLVDSYGSLFPDQVRTLFKTARERLPQRLGFHGHDNISLAFANTLAALEAGAEIVDATLLGMGRGAGNLKTELITAHRAREHGVRIDYLQISGLLDQLGEMQRRHGWGINTPYIISGLERLPQQEIMSWLGKRRYSTGTIVEMLQGRHAGQSDVPRYAPISESAHYPSLRKTPTAVIIGGGPSAVQHAAAIAEYAASKGAVIIHSSGKNMGPYVRHAAPQVLCLAGQETDKGHTGAASADAVLAYVVSDPPRIGPRIPETWVSRTHEVTPVPTDPPAESADRSSPLGLALGTALALGKTEVFLAGFDGYPQNPGDARLLGAEVQGTINWFARRHHEVRLRSLTPTAYDVETTSVYAQLEHPS